MNIKNKKNIETWKREDITVKEIHDDFESSSNIDIFIEEKIKEIQKCEPSEYEIQLKNKYQKAGFPIANKLLIIRQKEDISKRLNNDLKNLEIIKTVYSHLKFITHKDLVELCKKYNLYFSLTEHYKEDIPEKNLDEIINFKISKEHQTYMSVSTKLPVEYHTLASPNTANNSSFYVTGMLIVAPISHFSPLYNPDHMNRSLNIPAPIDPIVLCPTLCQGFFIVSKWGDEANLPEVQEEKKN